MIQRVRQVLQDQRGNALILTALSLVALLGFGAISVDVAAMAVAKAQAQAAADGAALAAAHFLPENPAGAQNAAMRVAFQNDMDPFITRVEIGPDLRSVTVGTGRAVQFRFAQVLGISETQKAASAKAIVGKPSGMIGIRPLGFPESQFVNGIPEFGKTYVLKKGNNDNDTAGNFFGLALGALPGASNYSEYLLNGYPDIIRTGQQIWTETGQKTSATMDVMDQIANNPDDPVVDASIDNDGDGYPDLVPSTSRRIMIVPVVDDYPVGRGYVIVKRFAAFYLEGGSRNGFEITGKFIREVGQGEISDLGLDTGLRIVKLVN